MTLIGMFSLAFTQCRNLFSLFSASNILKTFLNVIVGIGVHLSSAQTNRKHKNALLISHYVYDDRQKIDIKINKKNSFKVVHAQHYR